MSLAAKLRRAPLRLAAGAYILNSGLGKLKGDKETAAGAHGMAVGAYPVLAKVPDTVFLKGLAVSEIALGAALLFPLVPAGLAGLALTGFAGSLLGMYARTPALHDSKFRPSQGGVPFAKDIWMAGIGVGLVIDAALSESPVTKTED
ncbi:hypothetical protein SAMN04515671_1074 [Nakamurella panacisegetis]|uniref:DoxX protein n=1 Tax=Nakamurella panacisegetis TaxID=1090615 RepID=A0A1H0JWI2_9ACTN|nr:hypothetical protein [Nakamurella panacisegetis]SDO48036.1 hypothetical protein SAMN04515671_1074 [Nakamurella panacisegetis]